MTRGELWSIIWLVMAGIWLVVGAHGGFTAHETVAVWGSVILSAIYGNGTHA